MNEKFFVRELEQFQKTIENDLVKKIYVFNEISSTNLKAKELAKKNHPEGTIVISKIQEKGRGRFNRVWFSPEGGLYFSIILRPKCSTDKATILPLLASVSISDTIKSICDLDVKIKWPNDVLVNGKKISGILLESETRQKNVEYVIIGIGFNLNVDIDFIPDEYNATSLSYAIGINLDFFDFFKKLLSNLRRYYNYFKEEDYNYILKEWRKNSDTIGKNIVVNTNDKKIRGKAVDIDENGFLIITNESGDKKKINSGDCFYIK